jgi:hypothetical protein
MNYYQSQTSINPTQFFNQWYYGQGYPTFNVSWNFVGNTAIIKSIQSTSMPSSVPVFITPMEYKLTRVSAPDTVIRVMHTSNTEIYNIALSGTVTGISVDPNNWVINKTIGPVNDVNLLPSGINEATIDTKCLVTPNPSNGVFEIRSNNTSVKQFDVVDMTGKIILKGNITSDARIDITDKANGVYMLKIKDSNNNLIYSHKLIKE